MTETNRYRRYTEAEIQSVKTANPLDEYLQHYYGVQWRKVGNALEALCCFHQEDTPSLRYTPGKGLYCFGCGVNCTDCVIDFLMKIEGLSFPDAMGRLTSQGCAADPDEVQEAMIRRERARVKASEEEEKKDKRNATVIADRVSNQITELNALTRCHQELSENRGFPFAGLSIAHKAGYLVYGEHTGERRLLRDCREPRFPCYAVGNRERTFLQYRRMDRGMFPKGDREIKADTIGRTKGVILGTEFLKGADPEHSLVVITEGITDFLSSIGMAYHLSPLLETNVIPLGMVSTNTDIDEDTSKLLSRFPVTIFEDKGEAGHKAAVKWIRQLGEYPILVESYQVSSAAETFGDPGVEDLTGLFASQKLDESPYDITSALLRQTLTTSEKCH